MNLTTKSRLKDFAQENNRDLHRLEQITTPESLLDTKDTIGLPQVVSIGEHSDSVRNGLDDASDSDSLLGLAGNGSTVRVTG